LAGFYLTDSFFRTRKIPYPAEWFGVAFGLGLGCWMMALWRLGTILFGRRKQAMIVETKPLVLIDTFQSTSHKIRK
jgi:hypothetical protein